MAHRKHSHYTRTEEDRPRRPRHQTEHAEQSISNKHRYSRYTDPEEVQPKRKRWAAGCIDRHTCPSYAYISTPDRSPDREDITQSRGRRDDYIEAREERNLYGSRHTTDHFKVQYSTYHSPPSDMNLEDRHCRADTREPYCGSDIEELDGYQYPHKQTTTYRCYGSDTEEGSDIVIVNKRNGGSDVASVISGRSSNSRSDRPSIRSASVRSDVQDRRRRNSDSDSENDSDDEGGYISLDDYIAGRSDCVSIRSLSEDEGEGSDAVDNDVEEERSVGEGSDHAYGSDVASLSDDGSFDDGEDRIDDGNYCNASRRR